MMIYFNKPHLFVGLSALVIALIILWRKNKSRSYLFFFSIFWIYMMGVVSVVVFPFLVGHPEAGFRPVVNLIPFRFDVCGFLSGCLHDIFGNVLLTIPFGIGVHFIVRIRPKNIFRLAIAVGFTFELAQLIVSLATRSSFRVADINDVIFNATGVLVGYGIFRIFSWLYSLVTRKLQIQPRYIFAYIYDVASRQN